MVGQFFTPEPVVRAMFRFARAKAGQRIIDPSCGDGAFLRGAPAGVALHGCEIDETLRAVLAPEQSDGRIVMGDALTVLADQWGTFDLAIGNPPFSAQTNLEKRPEVLRGYDLGDGRPQQCLELLFLELFLRLVRPGGHIAIVLPDGPLSNRPFAYVRRWLLDRAQIEAIISLPRGIFSSTAAKTNIVIAKKQVLSGEPHREPTWLWACEALEVLSRIPEKSEGWRKKHGRRAVLADLDDWRPEAHGEEGFFAKDPVKGGTVRLGDCFQLRTGFARYAKERVLFDAPAADRVFLLRAKNIHPGGGLRVDEHRAYVANGGPMHKKAALVQPGEIAFVRVGVGCYGRAALVPEGFVAQADDWIHLLTPTRPVDAAGLVSWMNGDEGRAAVRRMAKGVGTLSISKGSLAALPIPARFVRAE